MAQRAISTGESSFLVEDFINAITSQLDRVQDALRLKAVNRPLTYALKDLALELQVFVEMDSNGNVRFRTSSPNETGASTVRLGFTTITRPMIEENTISLAVTRSPSLDEMGLDLEQQKRLEQLGVRNAAQLRRLGTSTGASTVSRLSGISVDRLRQALNVGRPTLSGIKAEPGPQTQPVLPGPKTPPTDGRPVTPPVKDPVRPPAVRPGSVFVQPGVRPPVNVIQEPGSFLPGKTLQPSAVVKPVVRAAPIVEVSPNTRRLQVSGSNLIGESGAPEVRLNNKPLGLAEAEDDRLLVELPDEIESGSLEVTLPDGQSLSYSLSVVPEIEEPKEYAGENGSDSQTYDPWEPR